MSDETVARLRLLASMAACQVRMRPHKAAPAVRAASHALGLVRRELVQILAGAPQPAHYPDLLVHAEALVLRAHHVVLERQA